MRIQHCFLSTAILFSVAMTSSFAEELPAGRPYPEFQIGVTGIWAKIPDNPPRAPKDAPPVKRELVVIDLVFVEIILVREAAWHIKVCHDTVLLSLS